MYLTLNFKLIHANTMISFVHNRIGSCHYSTLFPSGIALEIWNSSLPMDIEALLAHPLPLPTPPRTLFTCIQCWGHQYLSVLWLYPGCLVMYWEWWVQVGGSWAKILGSIMRQISRWLVKACDEVEKAQWLIELRMVSRKDSRSIIYL